MHNLTDLSLFTRRRFLQTTILGGAIAPTVPAFVSRTLAALEATAGGMIAPATGRDDTILIILQLAGGNDGLNTVVPFADDAYHRARPGLAVAADKVSRLDDYCGLHPALHGIARLAGEGHATIVQGVGYPNPNRSHFRSTEIWHTASDASQREPYGWLGRFCDAACSGDDPGPAIAVGGQMPQILRSASGSAISIGAPKDFAFHNGMVPPSEEPDDDADAPEGGAVDALFGAMPPEEDLVGFLQRTALDAVASSTRVHQIIAKAHVGPSYPATELGKRLELVARLIGGGLTSRIYYVSLGGFDTHANQKGAHENRLSVFDDAIDAFCTDLRGQGNFDRVMVMTFSEFGRRVAENASGGTDHGAAAPVFLFGGALRGGLFGRHPSLTDLQRGDLVHSTDFRSVYATLLEQWLRTPSEQILGKTFAQLPLLRTAGV